jgi:hypothetical protein
MMGRTMERTVERKTTSTEDRDLTNFADTANRASAASFGL